MSDANDCSGAGGSGTNDGSETWSLILPLLIAALGALLLWMAAIVLLKHEIADEFDIMRHRVFGPANVDI